MDVLGRLFFHTVYQRLLTSTTPDFASLKSEASTGQKSGYEVGVDRGRMGGVFAKVDL